MARSRWASVLAEERIVLIVKESTGLRYVGAISNLEIYRHPLPALVETVRQALLRIKVRAPNSP